MLSSLVDQDIHNMIKEGKINLHEGSSDMIQPASLDLPLGDSIYVLKNKFLPLNNDVEDILENNSIERMPLDKRDGTVLYKGNTYLVPVGNLSLDQRISGRLSPKSSIGRIDLLVRGVFDRTGLYDTVGENKKGKLYLEITPQSYNTILRKGDTLSQMMFFDGCDSNNIKGRELLYDDSGNNVDAKTHGKDEDRILMHLDLNSFDTIGYRSRATNNPIDLRRRDQAASEFFEPIRKKDGKVTLEKDRFYIFCTKERISVPLDLSAEMIPFFNLIGELRVHYAGFFDPGFGYGKNGEVKGRKGVLEVRPHETMTVYDEQPICLMEFYSNRSIPLVGYGESKGSNYHDQNGPKLSKHFDMEK